MNGLKIIYMGTPDFGVPSLDILIKNGYNVKAVITAPDKPAGRGMKLSHPAIKKYALEKSIPVLQPHNLKDPGFIEELSKINADLQIVVAFRMLPEIVWAMPRLGTFNLHASLLPDYRGAAPINWAIINGEKETGITTFFLDHKIDTGKIILQEKVKVNEGETAGELHDELMFKGAELVLKTVQAISSGKYTLTEQNAENSRILKQAPKIFKEDTQIDWNMPSQKIVHLINGLSPYPGAFTLIKSKGHPPVQLKIFTADHITSDNKMNIGQIISNQEIKLGIVASDGIVRIKEVQISGKKRMKTEDFLRGFQIKEGWFAQ